MNEYLKQYIELQKQFRETEGNPDSVRALYTFKEELEQSDDQQAKEVLVDVYDLLDFKKDAYELLCQIGNRSDKKTLKRLGVLKDYAENWGNHYAIPKPQTPEENKFNGNLKITIGKNNYDLNVPFQTLRTGSEGEILNVWDLMEDYYSDTKDNSKVKDFLSNMSVFTRWYSYETGINDRFGDYEVSRN